MRTFVVEYDYEVGGELFCSGSVMIIAKSEDAAREAFIETHTPMSTYFGYKVVGIHETELEAIQL